MIRAIKISGVILFSVLMGAGAYRWMSVTSSARTAAEKKPQALLERGPTDVRQVALTFDATSGVEGLPELLAALERDDVTATFFLGGLWACEHPAFASMMAKKGHVIANHGWSNKVLSQLKDWEIRQEIVRADDRFVSWFGDRYHPLFRAPFDAMDQRVFAIAGALGFRAVRWSIDPLDAEHPLKSSACFLADTVIYRSDEELMGAIVHFHVGVPETAAAIPVIVRDLRERGFEFVPVSAWTSEHLASAASGAGEASPAVFSTRKNVNPTHFVQVEPAEFQFASANPYDRKLVDRFTESTLFHHITTTKP